MLGFYPVERNLRCAVLGFSLFILSTSSAVGSVDVRCTSLFVYETLVCYVFLLFSCLHFHLLKLAWVCHLRVLFLSVCVWCAVSSLLLYR